MNLQSTEDSIARRLVDFASGLVYGLDGKIELVANRVYLLTPANVEVSAEERETHTPGAASTTSSEPSCRSTRHPFQARSGVARSLSGAPTAARC